MGAVSADTLREVKWAKSYLFEIEIQGAPQVGGSFPAVGCSVELYSVRDLDLEVGNYSAKLPLTQSINGFTVTFMDSQEGAMLRWLIGWQEEVYSMNGVLPLADAVKLATVSLLDSTRSKAASWQYFIMPTGTLLLNGDQNPGPMQFTATFISVGSP